MCDTYWIVSFMSKITPIWQIVFEGALLQWWFEQLGRRLEHYGCPCDFSPAAGIFTGSIRTGHGGLRRTVSTASDDDAARNAVGWCQPNWGVQLLSISAREASYCATGFVT
jgi:hypothetical protein